MPGNNLGSLNRAPDYLKNITLLNISLSNITDLDEKVMVIMKNAEILDIRKNILQTLPQTAANKIGSSKLWISDNPYDCNCNMMWMKNWLMDSTVVQDKDNVICSTGNMKSTVRLD